MSRTETEIKKEITDYLRNRGYTVHRMNSGKAKVKGGYLELCEKGTPDILVLGKDKYILWIETKKPGGNPTEEQLEKIAYYKTLGHSTLIAESIENVIQYLNNAGLVQR